MASPAAAVAQPPVVVQAPPPPDVQPPAPAQTQPECAAGVCEKGPAPQPASPETQVQLPAAGADQRFPVSEAVQADAQRVPQLARTAEELLNVVTNILKDPNRIEIYIRDSLKIMSAHEISKFADQIDKMELRNSDDLAFRALRAFHEVEPLLDRKYSEENTPNLPEDERGLAHVEYHYAATTLTKKWNAWRQEVEGPHATTVWKNKWAEPNSTVPTPAAQPRAVDTAAEAGGGKSKPLPGTADYVVQMTNQKYYDTPYKSYMGRNKVQEEIEVMIKSGALPPAEVEKLKAEAPRNGIIAAALYNAIPSWRPNYYLSHF